MCTKGFSSFGAMKAHQLMHEGSEESSGRLADPSKILTAMEQAFSCRFCNEKIMYGKHLDAHIRLRHSEVKESPYICTLCPSQNTLTNQFKLFYHYEMHLRDHGVFIDNVCRFCRITNLNRIKFNEHFKVLHPYEMPYECPWPDCNKLFKRKQLLTDHITMHRVKDGESSDDLVNPCNECGKVFYTKKKYLLHVRKQHDGKGLAQPDWHKKTKRVNCHLCPKSFSSRNLLQSHIRMHENNPSFMCDHCGKAFYRKDRLAIHTRSVHLGLKKYACEICNKKFMDNYKLRRHMKTHISGRAAQAIANDASKTFKTEIVMQQEESGPNLPNHGVITAGSLPTAVGDATTHLTIVREPSMPSAPGTVTLVRDPSVRGVPAALPSSYQHQHIIPPPPAHTLAPTAILHQATETGELLNASGQEVVQVVEVSNDQDAITYLRKLEGDDTVIEHTILLNPLGPAKRSTVPDSFNKFEMEDSDVQVREEGTSPVDFTQAATEGKIYYIPTS
eukprot:TRINITY_DN5804_c0_g1_i5.p1 TRINITY_DN5804_c0_g1~~TRINITY_DN5804_c0_g1_i5.p1  ORF type:complete len:503 (-),score=66.67 TRINITY_DN5804_c0_g1_i5:471-1979(-)